jgi:peroxiredoxin
MQRIRKWIIGGLLVFLVLLPMASGCGSEGEAKGLAPDFSLNDLSGRSISLTQYRGQVTLVDFWATWCPPCRMSIPELVSLQEKYGQKGLVILGISLDSPQQVPDEYLRVFKSELQINYKILRYNQKVIESYFGNESPAIPTMFLIDRNGKIRKKFVGFRPGAIEESLKGLMG